MTTQKWAIQGYLVILMCVFKKHFFCCIYEIKAKIIANYEVKVFVHIDNSPCYWGLVQKIRQQVKETGYDAQYS